MPDKNLFSGYRHLFLVPTPPPCPLFPHIAEEARVHGCLFYEEINFIKEGSTPHDLITSKSHFQISSHLGLVIAYEFWEDRNRQSRVAFLLSVSNQLIDAHNQSIPLSRVYVPNQRASGIKCICPRFLVRSIDHALLNYRV